MPRNISSVRNERNRTERKARYIRLKNKMRKYPDSSFGGEFYCDQLLGAYGPSLGADFSFFHTQKKRYYACCLQTLECKVYTDFEDYAHEQASQIFPYPSSYFDESFNYIPDAHHVERQKLHNKLMDDFIVPVKSAPSIHVKNYGPVAVGLWATVNKEYVDEHGIREFIAFFRSLGEPIKAGWSWYGEEIEVDPRRIHRAKAA